MLLCLPGAGCSPAIYDAVHVDGWTTCAVDWAYGPTPLDPRSIAERIGGLLTQRRAPTVVAGHSMGAAVAALTASLFPERVAGLIISNTGVNSRNHGDPQLLERMRQDWGSTAQEAFLLSCFERVPAEPLRAELCNYLKGLPLERLIEAISGLRALDLAPALGMIRTPTLIAHGVRDTRRRVDDAEALASAIAGARLQWLPGGHTPMVDCTNEYQTAVAVLLVQVLAKRTNQTDQLS